MRYSDRLSEAGEAPAGGGSSSLPPSLLDDNKYEPMLVMGLGTELLGGAIAATANAFKGEGVPSSICKGGNAVPKGKIGGWVKCGNGGAQ